MQGNEKFVMDLNVDKEVLGIINKRIKYIWEEKIKEDYKNGWLLKEDTLKNALYYHIRMELSSLFQEHNIRIFTEFTDAEFKESNLRPDIVIATANFEDGVNGYYGDDIKECLAVIEIKYKSNFSSHKKILDDYDKLQVYADKLNFKGKLYMATIWECEDEATTWIRKNAAWAKNKVVELNASYKKSANEPQFYVYEH